MAEALNIQDTSWSGPAASYFYVRAVIGIDTVEKGCIYVQDGIKKVFTIPRIEVGNFIQKRNATPVSAGSVLVDGKVIAPQDMMLYYEFNPRDFEQHFYAANLSDGLLERKLPATVENFMLLQTSNRLNEFFEYAIWRSRKSYDPAGLAVLPATKNAAVTDAQYLYFDGLMTKLLNDPTTVLVPSPVVLTAANIRSQFQAAYQLVPRALLFKYGAKGLKIICGYLAQQLYEQALREDTFKNEPTTEKGINKWSGYDVVPCAGVPDNTFLFVIARPDNASNLWLGLNSSSDEEQLQMARKQANSEIFFVKGLFKLDAQTGFPDQIVLYTSIIA